MNYQNLPHDYDEYRLDNGIPDKSDCENCERSFKEDQVAEITYLDQCGNKMLQWLCEDCTIELAPRWGKD